MTKVFVTGASGFLGAALIECLAAQGFSCTAALRRSVANLPPAVQTVKFDSLDDALDWSHALAGQEVVVHCAARVHVMNDTSADPLVEYRKVNVLGTLHLAAQAAAAGVRRFIFISSIKVNGESTQKGAPFRADDAPSPRDPYGVSKMEAEKGLLALAAETGMEVVIIRPVLVYGPGVKANFQSMMRWMDKGVPLPFAAIDNRRSLVALDNLVDLIITCIGHPSASNQIFLVSDGDDLSTAGLLARMAQALNKRARLFPVPAYLLQGAAALLGKSNISQRLLGSLQVDISKTKKLLQWEPPLSVDAALKATAVHYKELKKS
ncbi:SDR family oxidoreductase [Pseudomonas sp. MF6751]|uniref:UDP-glucose 4-epimerase family protein n=1 Tax=Pseudomonas TaxID=286 RepID=UPI0018E63B5F|nr:MULTISPECIES: SDR family oxidoreductase [Pseudomonas]MBI6657951.1 SDR family oxidoreductase [Pseudomonas carnis]MBI6661163.1 SDR family oxidoreductase [Pseudomonas carnis]MBI6688919.1 SDR family oxidoreductase [Pseudomonas carnis]MBK3476637.1 SDR family oxidoreductase [Pseudomonas sp. MF6751]